MALQWLQAGKLFMHFPNMPYPSPYPRVSPITRRHTMPQQDATALAARGNLQVPHKPGPEDSLNLKLASAFDPIH